MRGGGGPDGMPPPPPPPPPIMPGATSYPPPAAYGGGIMLLSRRMADVRVISTLREYDTRMGLPYSDSGEARAVSTTRRASSTVDISMRYCVLPGIIMANVGVPNWRNKGMRSKCVTFTGSKLK
ncbi:hypothetical protein EON62_00765, partial [archaeon]